MKNERNCIASCAASADDDVGVDVSQLVAAAGRRHPPVAVQLECCDFSLGHERLCLIGRPAARGRKRTEQPWPKLDPALQPCPACLYDDILRTAGVGDAGSVTASPALAIARPPL